MIPRRLLIKGSRNNGAAAITHPRANPLTLRVTPDAGGVPVSGSGLLRAELRASRTDDNTPLATVQLANPEGSGPWDITFSGAQMNQQLDGRPSRQCWLVVYLLDSAGQRDTLHTANLTITEDGASLDSALPPDVTKLLDEPTADGRYAPLSLTEQMEAVQEQLATLLHVPMAITSLANSVGTVEIGSTVTSVTLNWATNKEPASLSLSQGIGGVDAEATSITRTVNLTADTTFTLTADDGTDYAGHSATASTTVQFRHRAYWGTSAATSLDSTGIRALAGQAFATGRAREFTMDGNGEFLYHAYLAGYDASSDPTITMGGFVTTAWQKTLMSFTNASGHTAQFVVWRSSTVQNGTGIPIKFS